MNRNSDEGVGHTEMLAFDHADLGYGRRKILTNLSLALKAGDFLGIVGPNGAGKTTVLKAMLGILKPMSGQVRRNSDARFAYVPQRQFIDEVFPLTVMDVALMGRYPLMGAFSRPSRADREFVLECLGHVGIADLAARAYRELSGGQKQRALIARALAAQPQVLILDEPTNDMDIGSEHSIMELLKQFNDRDKITVVMVSHLLNVVINYARTLALIDGGLRVVGGIEDVLSPKNLTSVYEVPVHVAEFSGRKTVLTGGDNA
jgi:ABC-type cobalamin/Fe3+-siderophores transport system ATPase subunit